jgi:hypothetical protein
MVTKQLCKGLPEDSDLWRADSLAGEIFSDRGENLLIGTFDLWLCDDVYRPYVWLWSLPACGLSRSFSTKPAACLGHFGFTTHHPCCSCPDRPAR